MVAATAADPGSRSGHAKHRPGQFDTFATHVVLNGAERYGIENLANLHRLPARGASIFVGLIPFKQGSGGPAKVLAHW